MPLFNVLLEYSTKVKARNRNWAITKAREEAAKYPLKMDATYVERV